MRRKLRGAKAVRFDFSLVHQNPSNPVTGGLTHLHGRWHIKRSRFVRRSVAVAGSFATMVMRRESGAFTGLAKALLFQNPMFWRVTHAPYKLIGSEAELRRFA
jgi:hypothetical protein